MEYAFNVGNRVRVQKHAVSGHVRTPSYLMDNVGVIERQQGFYRKPEDLAYGKYDGEAAPLYAVRFDQRDLWPDYDGPHHDSLLADIFEYWLDPAD